MTKLFLKELKTHGLERLFHDVEMPLMVVLLHMEISGVLVDRKALEKLSKELSLSLSEAIDMLAEFGIKAPITYEDYLKGYKLEKIF